MPPIVEVNDLTKRFGSFVAVDHISFAIEPGEVFGLLGPNGAGKTTTIRMINTLLTPTSGQLSVAGIDVTRSGGPVRHILGYVPQALSADGALTGYENLLIFAKLLGMPRAEREERIRDVLTVMRLHDAADKLVREYSGGMIRRLEVGQAILHEPHLLILDEPTVGLDPIARRSVWETIDVLRQETGMTVLMTTHYMEEADNFCRRVAIMDHGRIAAIGTPLELKAGTGALDATLDDVFTTVTGNTLESGGSYREIRQLRRRVQRYG